VLSSPHLIVVGRSPMAYTLSQLARDLGWRADVIDGPEFVGAEVDARAAAIVVATQGHGDEEAVEHAVAAQPAYVGLVASPRRGEAVLGYLADRGVARERLDRVRVPAGLDLGHTSHREIAVAVLAELVQLRARGSLAAGRSALPGPARVTAIDTVCGMTVVADTSSRPFEYAGTTYYFCSAGCRGSFEKDPAAYLSKEARC
jgi:xanthine dehydrogenase accessory factor